MTKKIKPELESFDYIGNVIKENDVICMIKGGYKSSSNLASYAVTTVKTRNADNSRKKIPSLLVKELSITENGVKFISTHEQEMQGRFVVAKAINISHLLTEDQKLQLITSQMYS